jgi:hypothetical protein
MNVSRSIILAIAIAIVALAACAPAPTPTPVPTPVPPTAVPSIAEPANPTIEIALAAGRDADQSGKARLVSKDDKTDVILDIKPGAAGVAQPAHIHEGACPAPGAVKFPLTNVVDGKSTTTLDVKLADLLKGGLAINVHKSAAEAAKYVACGDLK